MYLGAWIDTTNLKLFIKKDSKQAIEECPRIAYFVAKVEAVFHVILVIYLKIAY